MRLVGCAIVVVLAFLAGLPSPHAAEVTPLAGTMWRPVPLSGLAGTSDQPVFLDFASAGKVSGHAGCNRFAGGYRQSGDTLIFGPLATSRKACSPDVMQREQRLLDTLRQTRRIAVTVSELTLKTLQGTATLRLVPHQ